MMNTRIKLTLILIIGVIMSSSIFAATAQTRTIAGDCNSADPNRHFKQKVYTDLKKDGAYEFVTVTYCDGHTQTFPVKPPVTFRFEYLGNNELDLFSEIYSKNETISKDFFVDELVTYKVPVYIEVPDLDKNEFEVLTLLDTFNIKLIASSAGMEQIHQKSYFSISSDNTLYVSQYVEDLNRKLEISIINNNGAEVYFFEIQPNKLGWNIYTFDEVVIPPASAGTNYFNLKITENDKMISSYNARF